MSWAGYLADQSGRGMRFLLDDALRMIDGPGRAIDLGSGAGADTRALLRRGWRVLAVDREPAAIALLRGRVPPGQLPLLTAVPADFTELALPPADLVHCGWSLPHVPAARFDPLWSRLRGALCPGGWFVGQLLGDRDSWAGGPLSTSVDRARLATLLSGLIVVRTTEVEYDAGSYEGDKHWHYWDVIARRPGS
jgi:tellurite methyltransferase